MSPHRLSTSQADSPPKPTIITATEMQAKSGQVIRRAFQHGEHFVVERDGYPVIAILPITDFYRLVKLERREKQAE